MNSNHTVPGVFDGDLTTACTVTINGTGTIFMPASTAQGFYIGGDSMIFNVPIGGSGSTLVAESIGQIGLNAANTYTGGTEIGFSSGTAFSGTISFGNNAAFGTGPITMARGTGSSLVAVGTGAYNIANTVDLSAISLNISGTPAGVTFSGSWDTGSSGPATLGISSLVILSGVLSDTQAFTKSGSGTLAITGNANTFGSGGTVSVSSGTLLLGNTSGSATGVAPITLGNTSASLTGNGIASGAVNNSGVLSATNLSGGAATLTTGAQTWQLGSAYQWAINNAGGTSGSNSGWDLLNANGAVTINANSSNPLALDIISLTAANVQGALPNFTNTQDYSWQILHTASPPISGFATSSFSISSAAFANALGAGVFSVSTNITATGGDIFVNFVHAPVLALSNVTVIAGSNAVFSASNTVAGSISATATYSWKSNNVTLTDGGRISGSSTPTLTIANAQTTDSATYTVLAVNAAGSAFTPATLTVTAAATSVTWTNPAPVTYGTPLDTTNELNATANVPGNFVYTPAAGAVLNAGTNTLSVIFTPTDTVDYAMATNTVSLIVTPAPLSVTASNASRPINTPNPTFTGSIVGLQNNDNITATYLSPAGTGSPAGSYPIIPALVDPNNRQTNYTVTLVNGTLSVGTVVTWANPAAIPYGTPLTANQLNATASTPGNFVYTPALGTTPATIGTYTLSVVFTPNDTVDYSPATNTVTLTVSPAPLTVMANNASRQAGITNPIFTGTITGLVNNDNITATYTTSANSASPVGTYPIVPTMVDPNNRQTNYTVSLVNGTLTVTAAAPPIAGAVPGIIPLPVTIQTNPGNYTLCPSQPGTPAPAEAQIKILYDSPSQATAQYLAAALLNPPAIISSSPPARPPMRSRTPS